MKYFNAKHTVGSTLRDAEGPIQSEEAKLTKLLEDYRRMKNDKLGRLFSPLTSSRDGELLQITNNKK